MKQAASAVTFFAAALCTTELRQDDWFGGIETEEEEEKVEKELEARNKGVNLVCFCMLSYYMFIMLGRE